MRAAGALAIALGLSAPVAAFVPKAERIAEATAKANEAAARSQALQLELTLSVGDRDPIGTGKLVTHPTGLARLELRDAADRTERHLLLGTEHSASRDGRLLERPREFLPPLFFLQVDSPTTLEQALSDFGLAVDAAAVEPCGTRLCYVIGDPSRLPPEGGAPGRPSVDQGPPSRREAPGQSDVIPRDLRQSAAAGGSPSFWVDTQTFEIFRLESRGGVAIEFGPTVAFGNVRFPGSIVILEPGREPVRFEIQGVVPVNAPAAEFTRSWLLGLPDGESPLPAGQP